MIAIFAVPAVVIGLGFSVAMFFRWRLGFYGLLLYLPFAGAVTLALYPSNTPKLFKDLLFVIPLYFVLFAFHLSAFRGVQIPRLVIGAMIALAALVLLQTINPAVPNLAVALIGAKVWLMYLPLIFVAAAFLRSTEDFHRVLRLMVLLPILPCALGLLQYLQNTFGNYPANMQAWYGPAGYDATQRLFWFNFGGLRLFRIPSTFPSVTQYFGFILASIVPAYVVWRADPQKAWRLVGAGVLGLLLIAGFLSGARAAFVFLPALLAITLVLEGRLKDLVVFGPIGFVLLAGAALLAGFDLNALVADTQDRIVSDAGTQRPVIDDFLVALFNYPLGTGTGMDTGPARLVAPGGGSPFYIETYYGKTVLELGVPGLVVVLTLFFALLHYGFVTMRSVSDPSFKAFGAVAVAFFFVMMVNSLKGWQLDLDPINVLLWVFAGLLFRLPQLEQRREAPVSGYASPSQFRGATA